MSVLIRRSDAIAIIQNADYKYPIWPHIVEAKEGMVQAIKSAPTIDTERHGRWLNVFDSGPRFRDVGDCSECNVHRPTENYCPNCGAKMVGEA